MSKARDIAAIGTTLGTVSTTELGYLDGVTSAIQTQIDGKQAINANVSTTELGYLDGVTSAIQTQLDGKIANTLPDAKGDIFTATAADTPARLGVGTNNQVLTADSTTATGLKWATPSAGATGWTLLNGSGTSLSGSNSVTVSSLSAKELLILVVGASCAAGSQNINIRFNSDSGTNYVRTSIYNNYASTYSAGNFNPSSALAGSEIVIAGMANNAGSIVTGSIYIDKTDQTAYKRWSAQGAGDISAGTTTTQWFHNGIYKASAAITSITLFSDGLSNFDAGTVYVWGAN